MGLTLEKLKEMVALCKREHVPPAVVKDHEEAQRMREWDIAMGIPDERRHNWQPGDEFYYLGQFEGKAAVKV